MSQFFILHGWIPLLRSHMFRYVYIYIKYLFFLYTCIYVCVHLYVWWYEDFIVLFFLMIKTIVFIQLQLTFIIILYSSQACSIVVRQSHTSENSRPDKSSTQLTPHVVITLLLTTSPIVYVTSHHCFITANSYLSIPVPLSLTPTFPSHQVTIRLISVSTGFSVLFVHVCSLDSTYKWNPMVFVFPCLTYFTEHNTL